MVRIGAHAITDDLRQDRSAAPLRELQLLQNQNARAFADDESVAVACPRAGWRAAAHRCAAKARAWRRIRPRPSA